jgi:hypothetical protein
MNSSENALFTIFAHDLITKSGTISSSAWGLRRAVAAESLVSRVSGILTMKHAEMIANPSLH